MSGAAERRRPGQHPVAQPLVLKKLPQFVHRKKNRIEPEEFNSAIEPIQEEEEMVFNVEHTPSSPEAPNNTAHAGVEEPIVPPVPTAPAPESLSNRRVWGGLATNSNIRAQLDMQWLPEMRMNKLVKMKLAKMQMKRFSHKASEHREDVNPAASDWNWLGQFCILQKGVSDTYTNTFNGLTNRSAERRNTLTIHEALMALRSVNHDLKTEEQQYALRVCELLGFDFSGGITLHLFLVLAALSQRITALDSFVRTTIGHTDMKKLEMKAFVCRKLWEAVHDPNTKLMSTDRLVLELRAGGISAHHEDQVRRHFAANRQMGFLDFLTYIPLFIMIHKSVIHNPFDDSRNR